MIQIDNIEIDLTAIYCLFSFAGAIPLAVIDYLLISKDKKLGFWFHAIKITIVIALGIIIFRWLLPEDNLWYIRIIAGMLTYSIVFDIVLNALRGKSMFYIGKTAYLDKLAQKRFKTGLNYTFWRAFIVVLIGIGIMIYEIYN